MSEDVLRLCPGCGEWRHKENYWDSRDLCVPCVKKTEWLDEVDRARRAYDEQQRVLQREMTAIMEGTKPDAIPARRWRIVTALYEARATHDELAREFGLRRERIEADEAKAMAAVVRLAQERMAAR